MIRSFGQRWTALLGLIAMLGVVLAVPAVAVAAATTARAASAGADHDMPCKKPCPECPKSCGDMTSCLVKCFHSVAPIAIAGETLPIVFVDVVRPTEKSVIGDRLIPPLLRPPSI